MGGPLGRCRLCGQEAILRLSHILPRFVAKWLKRTAVGGTRSGDRPNVRVQDGPKRHFLCQACEERFQRWESPFAAKVFEPLHLPPGDVPSRIEYDAWCLRFAVSVSWRILASFSDDNRLQEVDENVRRRLKSALEHWSSFLLGRLPHVGEFQHHLLPLGMIEHPLSDSSSFLNRYIMRSYDYDFATNGRDHIIFWKLGRIFLFGLVPINRPSKQWADATRLRVRNGVIQTRGFVRVATGVMDFINARAEIGRSQLSQMSPAQKSAIAKNLKEQARTNPGAEIFQALERDIELFGYDPE